MYENVDEDDIFMTISNPPYIANDYKLPDNVKFEPSNALFGGNIGDELLKDITLLVDKPDEFSLTASPEFLSVKFNKMPLRLILLNLVSNAIKHHDEKTGTIDISLEETTEHYLIKVADDGPGIEDTYHQKIFKMFQTLQPARVTDEQI